MSLSEVYAVIPVKRFDQAKNRLAGILDARQRRQLSQTMLRDVLGAVERTDGLAGAVVISADPLAHRMAAEYGADALEDPVETGPSAAIAMVAEYLTQKSRASMMAIMADVPLASSEELTQMLSGHGDEPAVTLAPARNGLGCNAAVCSPADVIALCFDGKSHARHQQLAARRGAALAVIEAPGIGLDIDDANDLAALHAWHAPTLTSCLYQTFNLFTQRGVA